MCLRLLSYLKYFLIFFSDKLMAFKIYVSLKKHSRIQRKVTGHKHIVPGYMSFRKNIFTE